MYVPSSFGSRHVCKFLWNGCILCLNNPMLISLCIENHLHKCASSFITSALYTSPIIHYPREKKQENNRQTDFDLAPYCSTKVSQTWWFSNQNAIHLAGMFLISCTALMKASWNVYCLVVVSLPFVRVIDSSAWITLLLLLLLCFYFVTILHWIDSNVIFL